MLSDSSWMLTPPEKKQELSLSLLDITLQDLSDVKCCTGCESLFTIIVKKVRESAHEWNDWHFQGMSIIGRSMKILVLARLKQILSLDLSMDLTIKRSVLDL